MFAFPASLSAANLEKTIRSALGDQKLKVDPKELSRALSTLEQLNKAVDTSMFDAKPTDAAAAQKQLTALETGALKAAEAAAAQARKVAQLGQKTLTELKANKGISQKAVGAVGDVASDAQTYATDLLKAAMNAQTTLKALVAKLGEQAKKDQAAADKKAKQGEKEAEDEKDAEADDLANEKDDKKFRLKMKDKVRGVLTKLKGDGAPPAKFRAAVLGKTWGIAIGKANGESEKKIAMRLAGLKSGFKDCKGTLHYDAQSKSYVFEGATVPTGSANATALSLSLKDLVGFKPKVRLQKPGERGEDSEGAEEDPETKVDPRDAKNAAAKQAQAAKDAAARAQSEKELAKRISELLPDLGKVRQAGGDAANKANDAFEAAKQAAKDATRTATKEGFDAAHRELDKLEKTVKWALSDKSLAQKAADLAQGAKKMAGDAIDKAREAGQGVVDGVKQAAQAAKNAYDGRRKALEKNINDAVALGGKGADEVKRLVAQAEKAATDAARKGTKEAFDAANRALDDAEKAANWALSDRSLAEKAGDVERGAKKVVDQVESKAKEKVDGAAQAAQQAMNQAKAEYERRRAAMQSQIDKALAAGGAAADELKRRVENAKKMAEDAARSGTKEAFKKAHDELDHAQKAVEWALSDKSAGEKAGEVTDELKRRADRAWKIAEAQRVEAAKQLKKITDPALQAKELVKLRVIETERLAAQKLKDLAKQVEAVEKLAERFTKTAAEAAEVAVRKVKKAVDDGIDGVVEGVKDLAGGGGAKQPVAKQKAPQPQDGGAQRGHEQAAGPDGQEAEHASRRGQAQEQGAEHGATAAAPKPAPKLSPKMVELTRRVKEAFGQIAKLKAGGAADADQLRKDVITAGNKATTPKGVDQATLEMDAIDKRIEAAVKLAESTAANKGADGAPAAADGKGKEQGGAQTAAAPKPSPKMAQLSKRVTEALAKIAKLKGAGVADAEQLRKDVIAAGDKSTTAKGVDQATLEMDAIDKRIEAAAKPPAPKAAEKGAGELFDLKVGGRTLKGATRAEAAAALRAEVNRLNVKLEEGWAYHVAQMNLPNEVPFQAWLTTGVDAVKSFFKGQDAAKIPDLGIWDAARDMMIEVHKAERAGELKAIEALLKPMEKSISQARGQVGKYDEQMQGAAQTGVDAGRFVEDTAASAIGKIAEERTGSKGAKVAAQAAAQGLFQGVEQLTEWIIGSRQKFDASAVAQKSAQEAVGAILKEVIGGVLKEPFKSVFGSYIGKAVDNQALAALGISRDAFMTATQKYVAEFAAKQGAGLIKSALMSVVKNGLPESPSKLPESIAAELTKGSAKQIIVDGIMEIAKNAVDAK